MNIEDVIKLYEESTNTLYEIAIHYEVSVKTIKNKILKHNPNYKFKHRGRKGVESKLPWYHKIYKRVILDCCPEWKDINVFDEWINGDSGYSKDAKLYRYTVREPHSPDNSFFMVRECNDNHKPKRVVKSASKEFYFPIGEYVGLGGIKVIDYIPSENGESQRYKLQCECGNIITCTTFDMNRRPKSHCGCLGNIFKLDTVRNKFGLPKVETKGINQCDFAHPDYKKSKAIYKNHREGRSTLTCEGCEFDPKYEDLMKGITCNKPVQDCEGKSKKLFPEYTKGDGVSEVVIFGKRGDGVNLC